MSSCGPCSPNQNSKYEPPGFLRVLKRSGRRIQPFNNAKDISPQRPQRTQSRSVAQRAVAEGPSESHQAKPTAPERPPVLAYEPKHVYVTKPGNDKNLPYYVRDCVPTMQSSAPPLAAPLSTSQSNTAPYNSASPPLRAPASRMSPPVRHLPHPPAPYQ
jgi:hypothetical protein